MKPKVVIVMPAYNAARTLEATYRDIPKEMVDDVILVDDASQDQTIAVARNLGIKVIIHPVNQGYGANQKTCYRAALDVGADIVVMLHPDYQYDPGLIPQLIEPITQGKADLVLGSRLLGGGALEGGMPVYKYISNRFLTIVQNLILGLELSEFHTGFRAYSRRLLERMALHLNSDDFVFDSEVIVQTVALGFSIAEIPCPTRYMDDSSSVNFVNSLKYGFGTLSTVAKFAFHRLGIKKYQQLLPYNRENPLSPGESAPPRVG